MKILIPVDGSASSKATLSWATSILSKENAEFYLLAVLSDPMLAEYKLEEASQALFEGKQTLENQGFRVVKTEYVSGDPVVRICQFVDEEGIDQVLMGSHGRRGLAKMLMGSVSQGVLECCKKPVFIYRHHQDQMSGNRL